MPEDEAVLGYRVPPVAAVCVYPSMVGTAAEALSGTPVRVASVATGFPSGQYPLSVRLDDVRQAVAAGASEIDMVINRGAFLAGRYAQVSDEISRVVDACGDAHLKVILETGELGTYDAVRRASDLAIAAIRDGDFIKTSTGKVSPAATPGVTLVMLHAIRDAAGAGRLIGMKPAGGIRSAKQAWAYLMMLQETLTPADRPEGVGGAPGAGWMTPELFRFGASSLLDDVIRSLIKLETGRYAAGYDHAV
jgi:deoxyribose-phosphate aldolase